MAAGAHSNLSVTPVALGMKSLAYKNGTDGAEIGERERQILDAATRVFQERGYDAATIQMIADEVGILKGSLYYYIDTKEDLLYKIVEEVHRGLFETMQEATREGDPLARIEAFIEGHVRFIADNLPAIWVFLHDFRALDEERREEIVAARDTYDTRLRDLLAEGQAAGVIRQDLDLDLTVLAMFGMINWMYEWYRPGGRKTSDEIGRAFASLLFDGIRAAG
jgi:AcrR family transcriptional regulator